jgi:hypothetical protein
MPQLRVNEPILGLNMNGTIIYRMSIQLSNNAPNVNLLWGFTS